MRSFKVFFLALLIFIPLTAYVAKDVRPGVGLSPGSSAPEILIGNAEKELLSSLRGKYLLLQFWAAYDAPSRAENVLFYNSVKKNYSDRVRMVSISFDSQELIFKETIRMDGIDPRTQILASAGENSKVYETYRLSKGFSNYLLDPDGVIVAKNITPEQLKKFLN